LLFAFDAAGDFRFLVFGNIFFLGVTIVAVFFFAVVQHLDGSVDFRTIDFPFDAAGYLFLVVILFVFFLGVIFVDDVFFLGVIFVDGVFLLGVIFVLLFLAVLENFHGRVGLRRRGKGKGQEQGRVTRRCGRHRRAVTLVVLDC